MLTLDRWIAGLVGSSKRRRKPEVAFFEALGITGRMLSRDPEAGPEAQKVAD